MRFLWVTQSHCDPNHMQNSNQKHGDLRCKGFCFTGHHTAPFSCEAASFQPYLGTRVATNQHCFPCEETASRRICCAPLCGNSSPRQTLLANPRSRANLAEPSRAVVRASVAPRRLCCCAENKGSCDTD